MIQDSKKERIRKAYNYLYANGLIHSVTELAEKLGRARPGVNNAMNGDLKYLNESFIKNFSNSFPGIFSLDWLLTGDGKMLIKDMEVEELNPSSLSTQNEKDIEYLRNELKSKDELIAELRKRIDTQEMLISVLQARISDLQSSDPFYFTPGVAEIPTHKK